MAIFPFSSNKCSSFRENPIAICTPPSICPSTNLGLIGLPVSADDAKGMAESITIPVGPAIAHAIYKAVGVRVHGYPMTAERILALVKEKKLKEAAK